MPKKKITRGSSGSAKAVYMVALLFVVGLIGVYLFQANDDTASPTYEPSASYSSSAEEEIKFTATGQAVQYVANPSGKIELTELGLYLTLSPELAAQGLSGVPGTDPNYPGSKSIAFSTQALANEKSACNNSDVIGWVGTLTRYEGASDASPDHAIHHTTAIHDYAGFHTSYKSVLQLCPKRTQEGSSQEELSKEKTTAGQFWLAIQSAEPIGANQAAEQTRQKFMSQ